MMIYLFVLCMADVVARRAVDLVVFDTVSASGGWVRAGSCWAPGARGEHFGFGVSRACADTLGVEAKH